MLSERCLGIIGIIEQFQGVYSEESSFTTQVAATETQKKWIDLDNSIDANTPAPEAQMFCQRQNKGTNASGSSQDLTEPFYGETFSPYLFPINHCKSFSSHIYSLHLIMFI